MRAWSRDEVESLTVEHIARLDDEDIKTLSGEAIGWFSLAQARQLRRMSRGLELTSEQNEALLDVLEARAEEAQARAEEAQGLLDAGKDSLRHLWSDGGRLCQTFVQIEEGWLRPKKKRLSVGTSTQGTNTFGWPSPDNVGRLAFPEELQPPPGFDIETDMRLRFETGASTDFSSENDIVNAAVYPQIDNLLRHGVPRHHDEAGVPDWRGDHSRRGVLQGHHARR